LKIADTFCYRLGWKCKGLFGIFIKNRELKGRPLLLQRFFFKIEEIQDRSF